MHCYAGFAPARKLTVLLGAINDTVHCRTTCDTQTLRIVRRGVAHDLVIVHSRATVLFMLLTVCCVVLWKAAACNVRPGIHVPLDMLTYPGRRQTTHKAPLTHTATTNSPYEQKCRPHSDTHEHIRRT